MSMKKVDGAYILQISNDGNFGIIQDESGHEVQIIKLVICRYQNSKQYCLFACDESYNVLGDTTHSNIDEVKEFAKNYYEEKSIRWLNAV